MLYWLLQRASDVPEGDGWLSAAERDTQAAFRVPKRLRDWRLGRWTAKRALVLAGAMPLERMEDLRRISICPDLRGVPCVSMDADQSAGWGVSISHTGDYGLAAVANGSAAIGCDIETVGRRGEDFVVDYFTSAERAVADAADEGDRSLMVTVIWSAKESALKALGVGLRLDTRKVEVTLDLEGQVREGWRALAVRTTEATFTGWWRFEADTALTIVSDQLQDEPQGLAP